MLHDGVMMIDTPLLIIILLLVRPLIVRDRLSLHHLNMAHRHRLYHLRLAITPIPIGCYVTSLRA